MENDFYTYTLAYPESMGGAVFYVGKGRKNRMYDHLREARNEVQSRKCEVIREIWANGEEVVIKKVHEHLTKQEAMAQEHNLIHQYPRLTNRRFGLDMMTRAFTIDRVICDALDALPEGERSKFVNEVLKSHLFSSAEVGQS